MSDNANDWVGQTLSGGRYRVDAKLGEGGMGFVYKVWDRNLDTDVVVKAPRKSMVDDPEFARRFALEIRSLVKLSHPNIVKVSDVGDHDGLPFAVMQYLSGGTLDERQEYGKNGRPLPASPTSLAGWLPGMAAALDFIHGKGYIHRDVKPGNILFDTHGHPYLSDFGVAKVLSDVESTKKSPSGMTGIGIVLGTPEYMAPELIMGNTFDGKVDQYALAATAYEILCGRKPFDGDTATAILVRQTTQAPPPMGELPANAAEAITRVMLRGLAKKPGERFKTCLDFANALVAVLAKAGPAVRPVDRMNCPSCGVGFAIPEGLDNYKGKKSRCRACGVPFRIAMDGLSLQKIAPEDTASPSGSMEMPFSDTQPSASASAAARANRTTMSLEALPGSPETPSSGTAARANRTVKMEAMPGPSPAGGVESARPNRTMKMEAMPSPTPQGGVEAPRAARTMKMEAMPAEPAYEVAPVRPRRAMNVDVIASATMMPDGSRRPDIDEVEPRSPWPWVIGGGGVAAALLLGIVLAMTSRGSKEVVVPGALASAAIPKPVTPRSSLARPPVVKPEPKKTPASGTSSRPAPEPPPAGSPNPGTAGTVGASSPANPGAPSTPGNPSPPASTPPGGGANGGFGGQGLIGPGMDGSPVPPSGIVDRSNGDGPPDSKSDNDPPKNDQLKTDLTLQQIVSSPKEHLHEFLCPSDLLLVNSAVWGGMDRELNVTTQAGNYHDFVKADAPFQIVLKAELARQVRHKINENALVEGNYPAIFKMRVEKDPGGRGFRGVVESLELLYYLDPKPIAHIKVYKDVYCVMHFDLNQQWHGRCKEFQPWLNRTKTRTANIRVDYENREKSGNVADYLRMSKQATNPVGFARVYHDTLLKWFRAH